VTANIYWRPVLPKEENSLDVGAPRQFIKGMSRAFPGKAHEWTVKSTDVKILYGMIAASVGNVREEFEELLAIVEKYGEVKLWAKY